MSQKSPCIKVKKIHGEKAVILANKLELIDKSFKLQRIENFLYIPIKRLPTRHEATMLKDQIPHYRVSTHLFTERRKTIMTPSRFLRGKIPTDLLNDLPRSMDMVGDIAIIEILPELTEYKHLLGQAVLKAHKNVQTVLAKASAVHGSYRLRAFETLAGESKTHTIHKEHGCKYYIDLAKAYFSTRLSYEHNRVASLVQEGETVLDLFSGIGPFAVLIAKTHSNVKVYAVDANRHAIEFLWKNIRLNSVERKVHPILGDARNVVKEKLSQIADRVIMNLPQKAAEYVDVACEAIRPAGGTIHLYSFVNASMTLEKTRRQFRESVEKTGRKIKLVSSSRFVRSTAPHEWQIVLDARIL